MVRGDRAVGQSKRSPKVSDCRRFFCIYFDLSGSAEVPGEAFCLKSLSIAVPSSRCVKGLGRYSLHPAARYFCRSSGMALAVAASTAIALVVGLARI
jgi:hypothetical protein